VCDGIVESQIITHQKRYLARLFFIASPNFDGEQFTRPNILNTIKTVFVDEVTHYRLSLGISSLRLIRNYNFN
jgi:hypothetical protein